MLPYQERLEKLLQSLFDDDVASEEVRIWSEPFTVRSFSNCCSYSYTNYGG
jgi:hypothetical protein